MNANELADALQETEPYYSTDYKLFDQAATMLRQQQAEIEALKKEAALQRLSDFTQEADNEPVAWMLLGLEDRKPKLINLQVIDHLEGTWIPLYTHPAKTLTDDPLVNFKPVWIEKPELTLTDEEIMALAVENGAWKSKESGNVYPDDLELLDFARAILRKAQEK